MTFKDIKMIIEFEDDGRPKVNLSVIFDNAEDMGLYLNKLKDFWQNQLQDERTAKEILDKMKEKK